MTPISPRISGYNPVLLADFVEWIAVGAWSFARRRLHSVPWSGGLGVIAYMFATEFEHRHSRMGVDEPCTRFLVRYH
jgi:hypothetical protein